MSNRNSPYPVIVYHKPLIKLRTSLVIIIPYEWLRQYGLKKGDRVRLELMSDGSLRIRPPK